MIARIEVTRPGAPAVHLLAEKVPGGWRNGLMVYTDAIVTHVQPLTVRPGVTAEQLVGLSRWIDAGNAHRDPEAITWGRLAKLAEEAGEVIGAYIGTTGQNPRKRTTHSIADVMGELLDVAITALGAYEHLDNHRGYALDALHTKIRDVAQRALAASTDAVPSTAFSKPHAEAALAYVDKSIDNVEDLDPAGTWTHAEVVGLLDVVRSLLVTGDIAPVAPDVPESPL